MFTPADRDAIRAALIDRARRDPRVGGAALVGSAAHGREDRWSDIDLVLQLAPAADEQRLVDDWTAAIDREFGLSDHHDVIADGVRYRVFLLASSLQIDVSFFPHDRFRATEAGFQPLFGEPNPPSTPSLPDAGHTIGLGWLYAIHARSALARGRTWQTVQMLDDLRASVTNLMCLRAALNPWHGREVDRLPAADLALLSDSRPDRLTAPTLDRSRIALTGLLLAEIERHDPARAQRLRAPFDEIGLPVADVSGLRRLVVVCGHGGSGKTTLADALSRELNVVCLHKDAVKAALHDVDIRTPRSYEIFCDLAEQQLANRIDLILEATFHGPDAPRLLSRWQRMYDLDLTCLVCVASAETRRTRTLTRRRHPAHAAADHQQLQRPAPEIDYSAFPGRIVHIDTDRPFADTLRFAVAQIS